MKRFKTILNQLFLLTIGVGMTSCLGVMDVPVPNSETMILEVMGERYEVVLPASEPLSLRTLTNEFDITVKVLNASEFSSVTIGGQPLADGSCTLRAPEVFNASTYIDVDYVKDSKQGSIKLRTYPDKLFTLGSTGEGVIPGDFYLSFIYQPLIMKINNKGRLLYYRFVPTRDNGTFDELGYWDFKKHVFDGKTYYSYHAPDLAFKDKAFTGYDPGMRILMDEHYVPVDTIHALASSDGYLPAGSPLDGHDFYFFSPTHWIASASYVEREVNGENRAVAYLQEVDNGEVVFDWWSSDHSEITEWSEAATTFDTSYDYVHFNSVDVLPDGNWLVSFRAISTISKVSHDDGSLLWTIHGEDGSLDNDGFSGQHYVRYHEKADNSYITVFDNGNAHEPSHTRTLRLKVDEDAGSISVSNIENLTEGNPSYFTMACGALLDFADQGFVVGWGWSQEEDNCNRLVSECAPDGTRRFEIHLLDNAPVSVNPSYRCVKCE